MRRGAAMVAALSAMLAMPAAAAALPTASKAGDTLTITGDGTLVTMSVFPITNGVRVSGATPGPGCVAADNGGAACPTDENTVLVATLSDVNESLTVGADFRSGTIEGRGGVDTLDWRSRGGAAIRGGEGDDILLINNSGSADDGGVQLVGEGGNDRFVVHNRISGDSFNGGAGVDAVSYAGRLTAVEISQDGVRNDGFATEGDLVGRTVEVLIGGSARDRLVSADDLATTLDGGLEADTIIGNGGRDTLSYSEGFHTADGITVDLQAGVFPEGDAVSGMENVVGSVGPDRLAGTNLGETLDGSLGADVILGRFGPDTLAGGIGTDIVSFEDATVPVTASLEGSLAGAQAFSGFEVLRGGPLNDVLRGSAVAETLEGGPGDDLLNGSGGMDTFAGGAGIDTVSYSDRSPGGRISKRDSGGTIDGEVIPADVEVIRGTSGNDRIEGSADPETLEGLGGDDTFVDGGGRDTIDGGAGAHDTLSFATRTEGAILRSDGPGRGEEVVEGDRIRDVEDYEGSPSPDDVNLAFDTRANVLRFGEADFVSYLGRETGVFVSPGGGADDGGRGEGDDVRAGTVEATNAEDVLSDAAATAENTGYLGAGGQDILLGFGTVPPGGDPSRTPRDVFDGGDGRDRFEWTGPQVRLVLSERRGSFNDELIDIEDLHGGAGDDSLVGDDGPNDIDGRGGNDVVAALGGDDRFFDEPGADVYGGGAGRDRLATSGSAGRTLTADRVADDGLPGEGDNVGDDVEILEGARGDDRIAPPAGGEAIGADGNDTLIAPPEPASVLLSGGPGSDTLDLSRRNTTGVTIDLAFDQLFGLAYSGIDNLIGTPGPDRFTGSGGVNRIEGGGGNDTLDGAAGADVVLGGTGADAISDGDGDRDQLGGSTAMSSGNTTEEQAQAEATAAGSSVSSTKPLRDDRLLITSTDATRQVLVDLSDQSTDRGDVLSDFETVVGTPRADRLFGDRDENTISGAGGDDIIEGRGNNDRLTGGDGRDTLIDGSPERDHALGGAGDDAIRVVDFAPPTIGDIAACGTGTADGADFDLRDTVTDCEGIAAAPVGQHPLTRVRALSTRPDARGRLRVRISCPRAARRTCRGTVFVERGLRRRAKPDAVARRAYRVRSGRSIAVRLRLERSTRRALARRGTLGVRLAARETDKDDRPRETSVPLTLRAGRK